MLLSTAIGQSIRSYCIFDSDFHTPNQIARRKAEAFEKGLNLHIWRRKEMENYLLLPSVIRRVLVRRVRAAREVPTAEDIRSKLFEIASEFENDVMDAFAAEFLPEDRAGGLAVANRAARERMNPQWNTPEGRLALASGKLVLAALSHWLQDNHGVSISASAIVHEMRPSEVHGEIASVLTAIEYGDTFQAESTGDRQGEGT